MGKEALPEHLQDKLHWDWPWPFSKIPRAWTSFDWGRPALLAGKADMSEGYPKPINPESTWQISWFPQSPWWVRMLSFYVSYSGKKGSDGKYRNYRGGPRYDNVDDYTNWTWFMIPLAALSIFSPWWLLALIPFPSSRKYTGKDSQDTGTGVKKTTRAPKPK